MSDDRACAWDGCVKPWVAQRYCPKHYKLGRELGIIQKIELPHRLSNIDKVSLTADCSDCGPSSAILSNRRGVRCRESYRRVRQARDQQNAEKLRAYHREYNRRYKFGLAKGGIEDLLDGVGWRCEICAKPLTVKSARLDHDHSCCGPSGRTCGECLRGILCNSCNTGIGMLGESPEALAAALTYLGRQMKRQNESGQSEAVA